MQNVVDADPRLSQHRYTADDLLLNVVPTTSTTAPTISLQTTAKTADDAILIANDVATTFTKMIQTSAQQQLDAQRKNLQDQLTGYQQQEAGLFSKLETTPTTDPHYAVYQLQLQNVIHSEQTVQAQLVLLPPTASLKGDVVVVQYATPHDVQASTKGTIIIAATAGIGLLLGALIMCLLIFLDNRLNSEDQVTGKLGMAYLGSISNNKEIEQSGAVSSPVTLQEAADICANLRLTGVMAGQWLAPQGAVLLITSNQAAEGKTTLAIAIATILAQSGNSVIVVDGNLRQPSTHLTFGVATNFGLSELLRGTGKEPVDNVIQRTKVPNIGLLPAGTAIANPVTLLEQRFPIILAQLRKKADILIIDGPALLSGAEASVLANIADGIVLVADTQVEKVSLLMRSKEMLTSLTRTSSGVVMNRVPRQIRNRYYAAASPSMAVPDRRVSMQAYNGNGNGNGSNVDVSRSPVSPLPPVSPLLPPATSFPSPLLASPLPSNNFDKMQRPHSPSAQ
jgi:capsular exopolysaccharide synthesis family protein